MPEVLSQSQIDELLNGLSSGDINIEQPQKEESKKLKEYDFRSPKKLTKEHQKVLKSIYEHFARHMASYFSGILRTYCEISVASIEEQPYFEYNNALPDAVLIAVIDAKPIEGSILVDISNTITYGLIERLLGGAGESTPLTREFTDIETTLMEGIYKKIAQFMKEAWDPSLEIESTLKQIENNARLIQSMPMDEVVAIVVLDVSLRNIKGSISFCIPCINLENIIEQINRDQNSLKRKLNNALETYIKEAVTTTIKESDIEVVGIFGDTRLPMSEILHLQIGDVIKLDQRVDSSIKLLVNNETWYEGIPGVRKSKKVIKISKIIKEDDQSRRASAE